MKLDTLIFGWVTMVLIFVAAFFLFWPDLGHEAWNYTKNLTKSEKKVKKRKRKKIKKRKITSKKKSTTYRSLYGKKEDKKLVKKRKEFSKTSEAIWGLHKKQLLKGQKQHFAHLNERSRSICKYVKLCK